MILGCTLALRLLKQNEQLKKKLTKSKWMKIKEKTSKKSFRFCDVSGLKNVSAAGKRKFSLLPPAIFAPIAIHLLELLIDMEYT